jgi:hypothetical protein
MLSRDFAERILGNANKIFMALESTHTAMEAERYWGEEITRKQSYNISEGRTDSGRYLSPMRFLNPQRSKSLQDRKGWIEGWEPRIKADEFIHGLGIGEAYLRHNGRPAKVKLIHADINPLRDFDLAADLSRFSQGNEPPLNLTEKVNRVVLDRMRAAKNNGKEKSDDQKAREPMQSKHVGKRKGPEKPPKTGPEITAKDSAAETNSQIPASDRSRENAAQQSTSQIDSLKVQHAADLLEMSEESAPGAIDQKQEEKLDRFSTWDKD